MRVERIDHVHVEVADREAAAAWYEEVLGLKRHNELVHWADDPMGPLILSGGDGFPTLSLFAREYKDTSRDTTVAFRVSGKDFLTFIQTLENLNLKDKTGHNLSAKDIVDHDVSWSIYFVDPYKNPIEITTYDYDAVRLML